MQFLYKDNIFSKDDTNEAHLHTISRVQFFFEKITPYKRGIGAQSAAPGSQLKCYPI